MQARTINAIEPVETARRIFIILLCDANRVREVVRVSNRCHYNTGFARGLALGWAPAPECIFSIAYLRRRPWFSSRPITPCGAGCVGNRLDRFGNAWAICRRNIKLAPLGLFLAGRFGFARFR